MLLSRTMSLKYVFAEPNLEHLTDASRTRRASQKISHSRRGMPGHYSSGRTVIERASTSELKSESKLSRVIEALK
jgi:hypothetical protein